MKILHIVAGELSGGAARGAYWLHKGLVSLGVDSKILTNSKETLDDPRVITITPGKSQKILSLICSQIDSLLTLFYYDRNKVIFSTGFVGHDFTSDPLYDWADIIHLHWINGGFIDIKDLAKIKKPIVWTMRDMWPMTGGCHCSLECEQYKTGCGECKQLGSTTVYDLSRLVWKRKQKYLPKQMKVVGISHWISDCARQSALFKDFDVQTIHNNIDTNVFFPIEKNTAKETLGIKTRKKIILTGSANMNSFNKGLDKYLETIEHLDRDKFLFFFFGKSDKSVVDKLGVEYKCFGFLYDNISLRVLYSACDVFVAPTIMDAFGKTLAEAMACGTPVVCFDATGPKDIVDHKVDGYKAIPFESEDLSTGIEWVVNNENYKDICENARGKVLKKFESNVAAAKYMELYDELIEKR